MATKLIQNGAFSGALAGLIKGRTISASADPANAAYAALANQADAIATEVLTANAALTAPMADADNTEIGQLVEAVAESEIADRVASGSTTAADYLAAAQRICALAKAGVSKLV